MGNDCSNENKVDNKFYAEKISKCVVLEKNGDKYLLNCKIKQYGRKDYFYVSGEDFLEYYDYGKGKTLWLSSVVKNFIAEKIQEFNNLINAIHYHYESEFCKISFIRKSLTEYEVIKEICENGTRRILHEESVSFYYFLSMVTSALKTIFYTTMQF